MRNKRIFQEEYLNSAFIILVLFLLLFSQYVVSNSLWPHELHHTRLPCPSLSQGACSNTCPLSQWCHPAISSSVASSFCLQSFPASGFFSNESALCIRWPKYWSFGFSTSLSNEYSEVVSFRIDSLDILAVQGTLKSLLQHHSSKESILQHSAFFMVVVTCICDYWRNHSFDYTGLCWQSDVSTFYCFLGLSLSVTFL